MQLICDMLLCRYRDALQQERDAWKAVTAAAGEPIESSLMKWSLASAVAREAGAAYLEGLTRTVAPGPVSGNQTQSMLRRLDLERVSQDIRATGESGVSGPTAERASRAQGEELTFSHAVLWPVPVQAET